MTEATVPDSTEFSQRNSTHSFRELFSFIKPVVWRGVRKECSFEISGIADEWINMPLHFQVIKITIPNSQSLPYAFEREKRFGNGYRLSRDSPFMPSPSLKNEEKTRKNDSESLMQTG